MEIYTFDETTYPGIPKEVGPETIQTNRFCDPRVAARTVSEHMEEFELSEKLDFDGTLINEHHFTYFSLNPSSTPLAAALIARTRRIKVGVIGHVLPLRHPVHSAEEFAQLDVLSGGRFIGGVVRGVPQEYVSYNIDPFTSRERFAESYDILHKCLTEELFDYEGRFYNLKAVSIWPLPVQNPLPIWMPAGSADTIEFAAERRIPIARVWEPPESFQDVFDYYRQTATEKFGWQPGPEFTIGARYIHVADSNDQAIEECRDAVMYVRRLATFSRPVQIPAPVPGMNSDRSFEFRRQPKGMPGPGVPFEQLRDEGFIVCGDPDYVSDWLERDARLSGYGRLLCMFHVGCLRHEQVMHSKRLFAEHVMPRLRPLNPAAVAGGALAAPVAAGIVAGAPAGVSPHDGARQGAMSQPRPLYPDANYALSRDCMEAAGEFVRQSNGRIVAGWELRVPERGPDGVPYRMILVGPAEEHRGSAIRLHLACRDGRELPDEAEVTVETFYKSGAERTLPYEGSYATFKQIPDQRAPQAAASLQQRAELGEDYIIRVSVSTPVDGPEPDPAAFDSYFEIECAKLWWYESA